MGYYDKRQYEKALTAKIEKLPDLGVENSNREFLLKLSGVFVMALAVSTVYPVADLLAIVLLAGFVLSATSVVVYIDYLAFMHEKSRLYLPIIQHGSNFLRELAISTSFGLDSKDKKFLLAISRKTASEVRVGEMSRLRYILKRVRVVVNADAEARGNEVLHHARDLTREDVSMRVI